MSTTRRTFLKWAAAAGGALGLAPLASRMSGETPASRKRRDVGRAPAPLNILILGGTGVTGPEQVEYAIARRHRVTLFNRNKTRPDFFKGKVTQELVGDLNNDTSALEWKKFDVVIDNPTTYPAWVRNAAKYLAGNTKHYMFISTTSVYRLSAAQCEEGDCKGTHLSAAGGDGEGYARLAQDASAEGAGRDAERRDQRAGDEPREGSACGVERKAGREITTELQRNLTAEDAEERREAQTDVDCSLDSSGLLCVSLRPLR